MTVPVAVSFGFPVLLKVNVALVSGLEPPICKFAQVAVVIFTTTERLSPLSPPAVKVTLSVLVGTPLGLQLLASPQLVVEAPPSQVFCAKVFATKNKHMIINSVDVFLKL